MSTAPTVRAGRPRSRSRRCWAWSTSFPTSRSSSSTTSVSHSPPRCRPFLREVRRRRPEVTLHVSTNGLALTPEAIAEVAGEALADRVVFSIDGASEGPYRRYRRGGSFEKARRVVASLAGECARAGTRERVDVVWQYILFEWNDGDEEIARARTLAAEAGARLSFVVTHTPGASRRYVDGSPATARLLAGRRPVRGAHLRRADAAPLEPRRRRGRPLAGAPRDRDGWAAWTGGERRHFRSRRRQRRAPSLGRCRLPGTARPPAAYALGPAAARAPRRRRGAAGAPSWRLRLHSRRASLCPTSPDPTSSSSTPWRKASAGSPTAARRRWRSGSTSSCGLSREPGDVPGLLRAPG